LHPRNALTIASIAPLAGAVLAAKAPAVAAEVTPDRLANPDRQPQNG
jgi:hypothetical protein